MRPPNLTLLLGETVEPPLTLNLDSMNAVMSWPGIGSTPGASDGGTSRLGVELPVS